MSDPLDIPADLMAGFLDEAPAYLSTLEDRLLAFEDAAQSGTIAIRDADDQARMNEIFRAAHSLKGLAASLGFHRIRDVTHILESILDQLRNGKRELSASDVEELFSIVDVLRELIRELTGPTAAPLDIQVHLDRLTAILNAAAPAAAPDATPLAPPCAACAPVAPAVTCADADLLARFVEATFESLDEANELLLKLEQTPRDEEAVNAVFRCVHNIKGACGAVGCATLQTLTHDLETLLDRIRSGRMEVDSPLITAMFKATDRIRRDVTAISERRFDAVTGAGIADLFSRWLAANASRPAPSGLTSSPSGASLPEDDVTTLVVTFPRGFADAPIQACILHNRLGDLGEIIGADPDVDMLENSSVVERLTIHLRTEVAPAVLERVVRAYAIESVSITPPAPHEPVTAAQPVAAAAPHCTGGPALQPAAAGRAASRADEAARTGGTERAGEPVRAGETLRVDIERLDQLMNLGGELLIIRARFSQIERRLSALLPHSNVVTAVEDVSQRLAGLRADIERAPARGGGVVALERAGDVAIDLETGLERIRDVLVGVRDSRGVVNDLAEAVHGLNRIAESMQKRIMQTRMVPIGPLFQRFRRVVRDLAKATGKRVDLVLRGEQTELDKRMIDELVDPLMHMVRNSVDHGIESPAGRSAAGKPESAIVTLSAFHRGRHICVQVRDDGSGINVQRVKRKIVERALATQGQVDALSDHEAIQYVFRPGFSTAEQVTDLSGRGVGMDIVRARIEDLNGTLELTSTPGAGTIITIHLPLTLAIIKAMLVRIGSVAYAIPLESVAEILTVGRGAMKNVQRRPVIQVREQVVPLGFIEQIFSTSEPEQQTTSIEAEALTVVIVGFHDQRIGLVVDEILGQEDIVIKDIASTFRDVQGVAGASIMGDGSVALILDVAALLDGFIEHSARALPRGATAAPQAPATRLATGK